MKDASSAGRLPSHGTDAEQVLATMAALRDDDRDWRGGRVFSLVYSAGPSVHDLLERAATLYSAENALNTEVFPSLGRMSRDILAISTGLLGGDHLPPEEGRGVRGYLTSGGTESLLQATRTARDWGRDRRGDRAPQHGAGHQCPRGLRKGGPLLRRGVPTHPRPARLLGRCGRHGRRHRRPDGPGGGVGALVPPGRHRPGARSWPPWPPSAASSATSTPASGVSSSPSCNVWAT